jgi:hypothetical protein
MAGVANIGADRNWSGSPFDQVAVLKIQRQEAQCWRDASLAYFQRRSTRPLPPGETAPAHTPEDAEALSVPFVPGISRQARLYRQESRATQACCKGGGAPRMSNAISPRLGCDRIIALAKQTTEV